MLVDKRGELRCAQLLQAFCTPVAYARTPSIGPCKQAHRQQSKVKGRTSKTEIILRMGIMSVGSLPECLKLNSNWGNIHVKHLLLL
jgi:hypothetical protein